MPDITPTATERITTNTQLPFNMTPAPVIKRQIRVIDLGQFDEAYRGWLIVVNPEISRHAYTVALSMSDETATTQERWDAMASYLHLTLLAWNFVTENPLTGEETLLPQPGDGGIEACDPRHYSVLFKGIAEAMKPPNG